ncbi:MAG: hypothetical protein HPY50_00365 [Firmicutes bacterium]|nr:hypothetical protein [Bacillota bacterium]
MTKQIKYIEVNPFYKEVLSKNSVPFIKLSDITRRESEVLSIYSDYSGDNSLAQYETFSFYLVDWNVCGQLYDKLVNIKKDFNIPERKIDYKGRKDGLKFRSFPKWINEVRDFPGLILLLAFDKKIFTTPSYLKDKELLKKELIEAGLEEKTDVAQRMVKAICYLPIIGHLLNERHKLYWITDNDVIIDTEKRTNLLGQALGFLANDVIGHKIAAFGYSKPILDIHKEFLCVPDLIAGALAHSLQWEDNKGFYWSPPDEETSTILNEYAKFGDVLIEEQRKTKLANIALYVFTIGNPLKVFQIGLIPQ